MSEARAHLDGRSFAAEREAAADRKQAAEKLDWYEAKGNRREFLTQDGFDVRNAAARRVRRVPTNQPTGNRSRARASDDNKNEARGLLAMSPSDQVVAKPVRLFKREAKAPTSPATAPATSASSASAKRLPSS
jgi:hypothetical protein